MYLPHEEALVVTLRMANYDIRHVLVNNDSALNVIFLSTLKKMEFNLRRVEPAKIKLTGFSGEVKVSEGRIALSITLGNHSNYVTTMDEFQVVD